MDPPLHPPEDPMEFMEAEVNSAKYKTECAERKLKEALEKIEQLEQKAEHAKADSHHVIGGDLKPIWLRKTIYWRDLEFGIKILSGEVYALCVREENDNQFKDDFIVCAGDSWELNQSECYSTYEAVPGGEYE